MSLGFLIQAFRSVTRLSFLIPLQWYIARIWRCESCSWWTLLCWTHRRFDVPTTTLYRCSWYWIITHSPFSAFIGYFLLRLFQRRNFWAVFMWTAESGKM